MRMGIVAGWEAGRVTVEKEKNEYAGYGATFSIGLSLPNGSDRRTLSLHYREEESWLRHHPPGLTDVLKHVVADPEGFLKQFPSDFALINKVHRTVPKDLDGNYGDDRKRIEALLSMKHGTCFPLRYFETPSLRCFICAVTFSPAFAVELFDNGGVRRGTWYVVFDMPLDQETGEEICVQLLAGSAFE